MRPKQMMLAGMLVLLPSVPLLGQQRTLQKSPLAGTAPTATVVCPAKVSYTPINVPAGWTGGRLEGTLSHAYVLDTRQNVIYCYYKPGVLLAKTVPPNSCSVAPDGKSFVCK